MFITVVVVACCFSGKRAFVRLFHLR